MRLKVLSTDRIGISQEILTVIAHHQWNLIAMEVTTGSTFLHIDGQGCDFDEVNQTLLTVDGVLGCMSIDFLPIESREQHLNAMLSRIPDPIFDIGVTGKILSSNLELQNNGKFDGQKNIQGLSIAKVLNVEEKLILSLRPIAIEVSFNSKLYIAETTPIIVEGKFNGAVLTLKAIEALGRQISLLQQGRTHQIDNIIGESEGMKSLKNQLLKFSTLDLPILITGETGTGKELFARAIHEASNRKDSPFLAINCASLSEQLLESELFGYVAGAFTGAQRSGKPGLFELANGGTVFLDEVAEMSGYLQAKLLRFLQDYSYRRLGGTKELTANVRIISASHQSLDSMINERTFREDLYYRLNVLNLVLPALRERKQDIPLLCHHFLENAAKQVNHTVPNLSEKALKKLIEYSWPGNIRQLQNVLFRLVALNNDNSVAEDDVANVLAEFGKLSLVLEVEKNSNDCRSWLNVKDWKTAQEQFEYELISQLKPIYPTTRKLAERLGVSHNKIAMKLRKLKLNESA